MNLLCTPYNSEMTAEQLHNLTQRWMREVWQNRNLAALAELHAPHFRDHSPAGRGTDLASYRAGVAELFAAFPDFVAVTEDIVVDASARKTAVRWTASGSHKGVFIGASPTHKRVTFAGIEILRFERGQIAERWGEWDGLEIREQLTTP